MKSILLKLFVILAVSFTFCENLWAQNYYDRTIGGTIYGSIQLVDTLPVLSPGIGGGMFFDYRFNDRFGVILESFFTTQNGSGRSKGEGSVEFLAIPAATFKLFILNNRPVFDPYIGLGVGLYGLTEGSAANSTGGFGMGAQIEVGVEYSLADNLMLAVGGTYRSIGIINSLSGNANATTYMPYHLFGRIGYRF